MSKAADGAAKPQVLWVLSQKGFFWDWPQRHKLTRVRPDKP